MNGTLVPGLGPVWRLTQGPWTESCGLVVKGMVWQAGSYHCGFFRPVDPAPLERVRGVQPNPDGVPLSGHDTQRLGCLRPRDALLGRAAGRAGIKTVFVSCVKQQVLSPGVHGRPTSQGSALRTTLQGKDGGFGGQNAIVSRDEW